MYQEQRQLKKEADKQLIVLERIKNNQFLLNNIIADVIALRNKQFSFHNNLRFSDLEQNTLMQGLQTDDFEAENVSKLRKEAKELQEKIADDIESLI